MAQLDFSIIIVGEISSGKSTLAKELSKRLSIAKASFGGYLKQFAESNNLKSDRTSLQNLGEQFIKETPDQFLADVIAFSEPIDNQIIFEGVRHKIIFDKICQTSLKNVSFYIDATELIRYDRLRSRDNLSKEQLTLEEFRVICNHNVEREITELKSKCTFTIDGSKQISEIVSVMASYIK